MAVIHLVTHDQRQTQRQTQQQQQQQQTLTCTTTRRILNDAPKIPTANHPKRSNNNSSSNNHNHHNNHHKNSYTAHGPPQRQPAWHHTGSSDEDEAGLSDSSSLSSSSRSSLSTSSTTATATTLTSSSSDASGNTPSPPPPKTNYAASRRNRRRRPNNNNHHHHKKSTKAQQQPQTPQPEIVLSPQEQAQYLAMDCEMVGVGDDGGWRSALARVVLLDWHGTVVLDQYVRPSEPVTDYRTFVSGITKDDLMGDHVVDWQTCRQRVLQLLQYTDDKDNHSQNNNDNTTDESEPSNDDDNDEAQPPHRCKILIGHALKNDLLALGIRYPWYALRDTAKWEPYMKQHQPLLLDGSSSSHGNGHGNGNGIWQPRKLKELSAEKLGRSIQTVGQAHCPREDAQAALDLYKRARVKWEKAMHYKLDKTRQIIMMQEKQQKQQSQQAQQQSQQAQQSKQQQQQQQQAPLCLSQQLVQPQHSEPKEPPPPVPTMAR
ncbi:hypothetical protein ACA910_011923 [Epithemia clementina (nom. ined.)]